MFSRKSKLTGEIGFYYEHDPAFDKELRRTDVEKPEDAPDDWLPPPVFDYEQWVETGDETCLPRKPGGVPVKVVCRRLSPAERAYVEDVEDGKGTNQAFLEMVRLQVKRLEPHPPDDPPIGHDTVNGRELLNDEWTEYLRTYDEGRFYLHLVVRLKKELTASARS
jgi:hypothetical protein